MIRVVITVLMAGQMNRKDELLIMAVCELLRHRERPVFFDRQKMEIEVHYTVYGTGDDARTLTTAKEEAITEVMRHSGVSFVIDTTYKTVS